jgi:hypothetical protein
MFFAIHPWQLVKGLYSKDASPLLKVSLAFEMHLKPALFSFFQYFLGFLHYPLVLLNS